VCCVRYERAIEEWRKKNVAKGTNDSHGMLWGTADHIDTPPPPILGSCNLVHAHNKPFLSIS
jgi:hypothetical protein